jgi:hypothetical protein
MAVWVGACSRPRLVTILSCGAMRFSNVMKHRTTVSLCSCTFGLCGEAEKCVIEQPAAHNQPGTACFGFSGSLRLYAFVSYIE